MPIYFYLSSHELPLAIDSIGNHWSQENVQRPKGFPHYHWLQTEQGAGEVIVDKKRIHLSQGTGILIAPYVPHSYYALNVNWTTSFVTFIGKLKTDINKIVGFERFITVADSSAFSFQNWIDSTIAIHNLQQTNPMQLSVDCYSFLMNINNLQDYHVSQVQPLYQRYVAPVIKEIETSYHQDITAQSLAHTVFISPQYLSRLFKRFHGCSTYQYLTSYRLNKAKELLVNRTELAINQISFHVGYQDTSHFIALFKSFTGCTPLEFRHFHH